jgi:hypothetical protein
VYGALSLLPTITHDPFCVDRVGHDIPTCQCPRDDYSLASDPVPFHRTPTAPLSVMAGGTPSFIATSSTDLSVAYYYPPRKL